MFRYDLYIQNLISQRLGFKMLKISSEIQFKTGDVRTVKVLQKVELHEGKEDGLPRLIHKGNVSKYLENLIQAWTKMRRRMRMGMTMTMTRIGLFNSCGIQYFRCSGREPTMRIICFFQFNGRVACIPWANEKEARGPPAHIHHHCPRQGIRVHRI